MAFVAFDCTNTEIGMFQNVRDFVENYYYTKETHDEWVQEQIEFEQDDTLGEAIILMKTVFSFYVNAIIDENEPVIIQDEISLGFEWGGYTFKGEDPLNMIKDQIKRLMEKIPTTEGECYRG